MADGFLRFNPLRGIRLQQEGKLPVTINRYLHNDILFHIPVIVIEFLFFHILVIFKRNIIARNMLIFTLFLK